MRDAILVGALTAGLMGAPLLAAQAAGDGGMKRSEVGQQVGRLFERLDADRDGFVTKAEGDAVNQRPHKGHHGFGRLQPGAAITRLDTDKDGRVSRAEAEAGSIAHFDKVDANRDGILSREERRAAWQKARPSKG